ncbi:hypothetical protein ISF9_096 [Microbacterium phage vB_MoxS-ISF9]|uniref:Uncharacterized protein n=1 Tax=Microbacterium phage vB_MoxS-ISF9 TaxID=1458670 RepID=W8PFB1_9CAUD|nr:hypothetical protein ISF9_096 [Microbacterium phage vB_MoxS-ISF9]AHL18566.1 hypothetical protein ISF9_096 [Microbacterium phage vB_MoxS-ISF9]
MGAGGEGVTGQVWVLSVMDEATAEPVVVLERPFTRFEEGHMKAAVKALEHHGTSARYDRRKRSGA